MGEMRAQTGSRVTRRDRQLEARASQNGNLKIPVLKLLSFLNSSSQAPGIRHQTLKIGSEDARIDNELATTPGLPDNTSQTT